MALRPAFDPAALQAANINPATGLATDYLNHYNEVAIMIGMVADAPEMADPILDWRPLGYAAHFRLTGFSDQDVAIAAYDQTSEAIRARFRIARRRVELAVADVQDLLAATQDRHREAASHASAIFALIASVGAVINGETGGEKGAAPARLAQPAQSDIDALFPDPS
jgi:hypothetical protein